MNKDDDYSDEGPWNESLNFIFPTKYVMPKSLKVGHWRRETKNKHISLNISDETRSTYMRVTCEIYNKDISVVMGKDTISLIKSKAGLVNHRKW